eukprot:COSAG01_NODE_52532_length_346_cov_0.627530_1_plen_87_part_01
MVPGDRSGALCTCVIPNRRRPHRAAVAEKRAQDDVQLLFFFFCFEGDADKNRKAKTGRIVTASAGDDGEAVSGRGSQSTGTEYYYSM